MPLNQQQKDDFDQGCYGMSRSDLAHMVDNTFGGTSMLAMSILSDAQQVLEHGDAETARKYMNIAKWIIAERLIEQPKDTKVGGYDRLNESRLIDLTKRSSLDPLI